MSCFRDTKIIRDIECNSSSSSWFNFADEDQVMLQPDQVVLSTNLFFKIDVLLPLVTGEHFQNTVDVTSVTYKL